MADREGLLVWARNNEGVVPQFVPSEKYEAQPIGDANSQVDEAMRLAKERNAQPEVGLAERIARMDAMTVNQAIVFMDGLSQHEKERYLEVEKRSKGRTSILGRYGW